MTIYPDIMRSETADELSRDLSDCVRTHMKLHGDDPENPVIIAGALDKVIETISSVYPLVGLVLAKRIVERQKTGSVK